LTQNPDYLAQVPEKLKAKAQKYIPAPAAPATTDSTQATVAAVVAPVATSMK
jgi:cytochrome c oxidase subunit 2